MFEKQNQCLWHVDHIISHFFTELKIYTHDHFNIADPSSMQGACNTQTLYMAQLTTSPL